MFILVPTGFYAALAPVAITEKDATVARIELTSIRRWPTKCAIFIVESLLLWVLPAQWYRRTIGSSGGTVNSAAQGALKTRRP